MRKISKTYQVLFKISAIFVGHAHSSVPEGQSAPTPLVASANLGLLIDKTSSIYLYVKLKALAS
jgi:2',3'-cyclic-nucleotide 2'-phosphodiesterase (5'-nucleotidase family)